MEITGHAECHKNIVKNDQIFINMKKLRQY